MLFSAYVAENILLFQGISANERHLWEIRRSSSAEQEHTFNL